MNYKEMKQKILNKEVENLFITEFGMEEFYKENGLEYGTRTSPTIIKYLEYKPTAIGIDMFANEYLFFNSKLEAKKVPNTDPFLFCLSLLDKPNNLINFEYIYTDEYYE